MNYKQSKILLLVSVLTLVGCNFFQSTVAKPPQQQDLQTKPSVVPTHSKPSDSATSLTYKIETYD
ncbi:hypothetical protein KBT16_15705 [Nostoc sp. CCCryo 231-06]|nr:hypothetical protein [Nostoc sp. CCCryo 231-06]